MDHDEYDDATIDDPLRWPLHWSGLRPTERWVWFERLWEMTCSLQKRYRLPVRVDWWESEVQVEVLAALAAWVDRYDSGEWDDPPGKLALLYDLERVSAVLSDGGDPFDPRRDRRRFESFLIEQRGCRRPRY